MAFDFSDGYSLGSNDVLGDGFGSVISTSSEVSAINSLIAAVANQSTDGLDFSDAYSLAASDIAGDGVSPAALRGQVGTLATGSIQLVDSSGFKWFINTDITFTTASSASGAASEASFTAAVAATTLGGGTVATTLNDAFDGYNTVAVNGVTYNNNGTPTTEFTGAVSGIDRQVVYNAQTIGSLQVTRKVFVPDNDAFARWLNIVTNTSSTTQTVTLRIVNNLGSDSNTTIVSSSDGDATGELTDTWVTTFQNFSGATSSDPRLGHILQGVGASVGLSNISFANGDDNPFWEYTFTLAPGETGIIMNLATGQASRTAAATKSTELAGVTSNMLQGMTAAEISQVKNFLLTSTVEFSQATYQVNEDGTVAGVAITLTRTGLTSLATSVQVQLANGTATGGAPPLAGTEDFDNSLLTINFAANQTTATVVVPIQNDSLVESDETLSLTLVNPGTQAVLGTQTTATLTILNDDQNQIDPGCQPGVDLKGNTKDNRLRGGSDSDTIQGLGGDDVLLGLGCEDTLLGGVGNDRLFGGDEDDVLRGNDGDDELNGDAGNDTLSGGLGNDQLSGNGGDDVLAGDQGNDRIFGQGGDDTLEGGSGNDVMGGADGDDVMTGDEGNDRLFGYRGNDVITGGQDNDILGGGSGRDRLSGGSGKDILVGNRGNDQLFGQQGNDRLGGGRDDDLLNGGTGNDVLVGGLGQDVLNGGAGTDRLVYRNVSERGDRIVGFNVQQDVIDLRYIFAKPEYTDSQPFKHYVKLTQVGANTTVQVDSNGEAAGGLVVLATLEKVTASALGASNFLV